MINEQCAVIGRLKIVSYLSIFGFASLDEGIEDLVGHIEDVVVAAAGRAHTTSVGKLRFRQILLNCWLMIFY